MSCQPSTGMCICSSFQALRGDPIRLELEAARELVTACRGSGRREQFALTVREFQLRDMNLVTEYVGLRHI